MSTYAGSLKWYTLARSILDYANQHTTSVFQRAGVVPGLIAWDGCDCGALYVMVNQVYACEAFPMQKVDNDISHGCSAIYEAAEFVLQVMECAPSPQGSLNAPAVQDLDAAARILSRDAFEVRHAVNAFLCAARDVRDVEEYIIDAQIVQGPSGGCVGTELRFRIALAWG